MKKRAMNDPEGDHLLEADAKSLERELLKMLTVLRRERAELDDAILALEAVKASRKTASGRNT